MKALLTIALLLLSTSTWAASGAPKDYFTCEAPQYFSKFQKIQCWVNEPPYVPSTGNWNHPVAFIRPNNQEKMPVKLKFSGYSANPGLFCTGLDFSDSDYLVVKSCAGHYPSLAQHRNESGVGPLGWWGYNRGDSNMWRLGLSTSQAMFEFNGDISRGIALEGTSYGGTGAILQSMLLRKADSFWGNRIETVFSNIGYTLFVEDMDLSYAPVAHAWDGSDADAADFRKVAATGVLDGIYYRLNGSPRDTSVKFNLEFLELCELYKIACFATWHNAGHTTSEKDVNLPFRDLFFDEENQKNKIDDLLPVFTNSSANHWKCDGGFCTRGHYNLGLSWNSDLFFKDSEEEINVSIRYLRSVNIGGGIPDQPENVTFDLTIQKVKVFQIKAGESYRWILYGPGAIAFEDVVAQEDGVITIKGLSLKSHKDYTGFILKKSDKPVEEIEEPANEGDFPLVYTRQPRHTTPLTSAKDPSISIQDAANWQHVSDVGRVFKHTESDIVIDDLKGNIKVIYNCTESEDTCAAQEAKVSPDGKKIIYSVARGTQKWPIQSSGGIITDLWEFKETTAELWIYEVDSEKNYKISSGFLDRTPDWCGNACIAFASNRDTVFPAWGYSRRNWYTSEGLQLYRGFIKEGNLTDVINLTPHEQFVLNPKVMSNGNICYSNWQGYSYRSKGTATNQWWVSCVDVNGEQTFVELGAHGAPYLRTRGLLADWVDPSRGGEGGSDFKALRPIDEIHTDVYSVTSYYRGNSTGAMGVIINWKNEPGEGTAYANKIEEALQYSTSKLIGSGRYVPSSVFVATPYGQDQDLGWPRFHKDGRAAGRAGYSAPWPGDGEEWMYTHARGWCYRVMNWTKANEDAMGGEPTCKKEIRLALGKKVLNPFDETQSRAIACESLDWQCWDARAVVNYRRLYGKNEPSIASIKEPTGDTGVFQVVNMRASELQPIPGKDTEKLRQVFQGNADPDYPVKVKALRIDLVELWDSKPTADGFKSTEIHSITPMAADGSLKVEVPCDKPLMMKGVDKDGNVIATDLMLHSVRCGEVQSCFGCHDGHSEERVKVLPKDPNEMFKETLTFRESFKTKN